MVVPKSALVALELVLVHLVTMIRCMYGPGNSGRACCHACPHDVEDSDLKRNPELKATLTRLEKATEGLSVDEQIGILDEAAQDPVNAESKLTSKFRWRAFFGPMAE